MSRAPRSPCRATFRPTPPVGCWPRCRSCPTAGTGALARLHADALLLARATGVRIGELRDLELDCVHQIDDHGAWLKVPLGKLGTERMVPLDEETVTVIVRQLADRLDQLISHTSAENP